MSIARLTQGDGRCCIAKQPMRDRDCGLAGWGGKISNLRIRKFVSRWLHGEGRSCTRLLGIRRTICCHFAAFGGLK